MVNWAVVLRVPRHCFDTRWSCGLTPYTSHELHTPVRLDGSFLALLYTFDSSHLETEQRRRRYFVQAGRAESGSMYELINLGILHNHGPAGSGG
jgi:hypothetical protein